MTQTRRGVEKVKLWITEHGGLRKDDVFISADVDEVMSRSALKKLKWKGFIFMIAA